MSSLAEELLKHEVIFKENLEGIFGKRPWLTAEEKVQAALDSAKENATTDLESDIETVSETPQEAAPTVPSADPIASEEDAENLTEENPEIPQGND